MQDGYNQQFDKNKLALIKAVSEVLNERLKYINKSLKLFSREFEFSDGQISKLLRGKYSDIKLSTLWKLANALEIPITKFIELISQRLPKDFNFYD